MTEKLEALDFAINVIREHEKKLDEWVATLQGIVEVLTENSLTYTRVITRKGGGMGLAIPKEVRVGLDLKLGELLEVTVKRKEVN